MSNVDLFIAYHSGELKEQEARILEERLATDPALKKEYQAFNEVYTLIRDQLQKRDEHAFRTRLLEAMERNDPPPARNARYHRSYLYYLVPLAGAIALLIALMFSGRNPDRLVSRFYHPERDQVLLAMNQVTRGASDQGVSLFREGKFKACMDEMNGQLKRDPGNNLALLYYLLASMEIDMEEIGLRKFEDTTLSGTGQLEQSVIWYATLAMVKSGRTEDAAENLETLVNGAGPYHPDAVRLQKMLLK
jgi:hypothetical protein